jgi:hypothetical protein
MRAAGELVPPPKADRPAVDDCPRGGVEAHRLHDYVVAFARLRLGQTNLRVLGVREASDRRDRFCSIVVGPCIAFVAAACPSAALGLRHAEGALHILVSQEIAEDQGRDDEPDQAPETAVEQP